MSVSITDKRFRRVFVSFFLLSCMMPLLVMILMVYQYTVPLLTPGQFDALRPVYSTGLSTVLVFQILGFFLLLWWVNSLETLTREIESISSQHLSKNIVPLMQKTNELEKISVLVRRLGETLQEKVHQVDADATQIKALSARLTFLASTDELTQLYNKRYFKQKLSEAARRAQKIGMSFWLVRFEVDHFSSFGEKNGDQVLKELGQVVRKHLPTMAMPFRMGRNEFAFILSSGDGREAAKVTHRLSRAVAEHHFNDDAGLPLGSVTISCGIAGFRDDPAVLYADAWRALATAQRNGRPIEVAAAA
ncbi:MAG: GGDEF domain-containing protein [Desulfobacterales bacterium]|nr:GGDEF domain-containing protein [Desulfobacterales bacterium]